MYLLIHKSVDRAPCIKFIDPGAQLSLSSLILGVDPQILIGGWIITRKKKKKKKKKKQKLTRLATKQTFDTLAM